MLGIDGKVLRRLTKRQILTVVLQNCEKSAAKHLIEKPVLNGVGLSTMFRPSLYSIPPLSLLYVYL